MTGYSAQSQHLHHLLSEWLRSLLNSSVDKIHLLNRMTEELKAIHVLSK